MPVYKGTLLMEFPGVPPCGFSESYEFIAGSTAAAKLSVAAWPIERAKTLSQSWFVQGFRLAGETTVNVDGKCVKKFVPLQIGACPGTPAGLLGKTDSPYTAVLFAIDFEDPGFKRRNMLLRGIPDTWWDNAQLSIPPADGNAFLAWFNYMKGQGVGRNNPQPTPCTQLFSKWSTYCSKRIASRRIGRPFDLLRGRR